MAKVRQSKNGTWEVDYSYGPKGKKIRNRVYGFSTRADANAFRSQLILRPLDQQLGYSNIVKMTLDDAIVKYQTVVGFKKTASEGEKRYFERFEEFFKNRKNFDGEVSSITLMDVQELQNHLRSTKYSRSKKKDESGKIIIPKDSKTLSAATVNRHFHTYRNFFQNCKMWNFISANPCEFLQDLPEEEKPMVAWAPEAVALVLKKFPDWALRIVYFLAKSGARRSEGINLEPKDVNLSNRTVTLKSKKGRGEVKLRVVPMTNDLFEFMVEQMDLCKAGKWKTVFVDEDHTRISKTRLSTIMHRAAIKAGCPGMNLHALRHAIMSQLARSGVSLREIQALAGHSNLRTTQRYLHTTTEELRSSLETHEDRYNVGLLPSAKVQKGEA